MTVGMGLETSVEGWEAWGGAWPVVVVTVVHLGTALLLYTLPFLLLPHFCA